MKREKEILSRTGERGWRERGGKEGLPERKEKGAGNKTFLTGITLKERHIVTEGVTEKVETAFFKVTQ